MSSMDGQMLGVADLRYQYSLLSNELVYPAIGSCDIRAIRRYIPWYRQRRTTISCFIFHSTDGVIFIFLNCLSTLEGEWGANLAITFWLLVKFVSKPIATSLFCLIFWLTHIWLFSAYIPDFYKPIFKFKELIIPNSLWILLSLRLLSTTCK